VLGTFIDDLTQSGSIVATTNPISVSGDYYINATASVFAAAGDDVYCYVSAGEFGNDNDGDVGGFSNLGNTHNLNGQAAIADVWFVNAGDVVNLYCFTARSNATSGVNNAFITATLINVDNGESTPALRSRTNAQLLDKTQIQNSQVNVHR